MNDQRPPRAYRNSDATKPRCGVVEDHGGGDVRAWLAPEGYELWVSRKIGQGFATQPADDETWWAGRAEAVWVRLYGFMADTDDVLIARLHRDGPRLVCTGLHVETADNRPLAMRSLRSLNLTRIVSGLQRFPESLERDPAVGAGPRRPGRAGHDAQHYERVALRYRQALKVAPERPVQWIAETERPQVHPSTVHRWLKYAREHGYFDEE